MGIERDRREAPKDERAGANEWSPREAVCIRRSLRTRQFESTNRTDSDEGDVDGQAREAAVQRSARPGGVAQSLYSASALRNRCAFHRAELSSSSGALRIVFGRPCRTIGEFSVTGTAVSQAAKVAAKPGSPLVFQISLAVRQCRRCSRKTRRVPLGTS